jgi:hypothetical protein
VPTSVLSDNPPKSALGETVPKEGPAQELGPNNEQLKEQNPRLVAALRDLIEKYRTEAIVARRHEIRRIRQARYFWQGLQNLFWDPGRGDWNLPHLVGTRGPAEEGSDETPRYQYVHNIFQAYGLAFIAVMSQDVPSVRFWPQSPNRSEDLTAAKAASDAVELIEQNNKVQDLLSAVAYFLWTDGKVGAYVRFVVDGQRFGWKNEDILQQAEQKIGQDQYSCPQCNNVTTDDAQMFGGICQNCGTPMNFNPAPTVQVPQVVGQKKVPNGQEVIDIVGGLELNTPVWSRDQIDFPYMQWQLEVPKAKLKAAYTHAADSIESSTQLMADDVYARASRLSLAQSLPYTHPGDALQSLVTFLRTWIRPWAFYELKDADLRDQLLQMFPDGCYVAFAGDTYCESRNESMDDHWRVLHGLPGEGQNRPAVGSSLIDIQEQVNDYANIQAENYEFGIPPIFADPNVVDFDALGSTQAEPAAWYPATAKAGAALADGFYQPLPAQVAPDMPKYQDNLAGPVSQFLSGLFPAVFGGEMEGNKTASGYAMARDQAMGRIGMIWRRVKQFYADTMMLSVDCFRRNRPEDVEVPMLGQDNEFESHAIRLVDLKGNIQARPEADETFPRLKSQQRQVIQTLMESEDPVVAEMLGDPANVGQVRSILGLSDFHIPGEDERNKQLREIEQMMQEQATPKVGPDNMPMMGPDGQPMLQSSVEVDVLLDNHKIEFEECMRWASSDDGQEARVQNPAGFANVRAHAMEHKMEMVAQEAMMAPPPMPGPGKKFPGKEPSAPEPPAPQL